jgi:hypothetical protein
MTERKHALLSASSAKRWLECPPSARLCEHYPDTTSVYAEDGTMAHQLCEFYLKKALEIKCEDPHENNPFCFDSETEDCANSYVQFILEILEKSKQTCKDPKVFIEQKVDYSRWVEEGFGTCDCAVIADGTLHICDYKHGSGVLVEADDNPQMKLYALGCLEIFDGIYDISTVSMTIFQPRRENVSTYTTFKESLFQWADEILKPTAELAFAGKGDFKTGEHCRFCKAKAECRKRAEENMQLAAYDFKNPNLLESDEIADILLKVDDLVAWAGNVKEFALQQALQGVKFEGFKVVEGRSNRKYISEIKVADTVKNAGFDPYEKSVLGITKMEKLLGKKQFATLLGDLIEKPQGKPVLVPETDKRLSINVTTAAEEFADNMEIGEF